MVLKPKKISGVKSKKVRYQTSNRRVATVNANGVITARKKGTVKITVTSAENKKVKAVFKLTVQKKLTKVGIKLEEKKVTMYEDEIYYLYPELTACEQ